MSFDESVRSLQLFARTNSEAALVPNDLKMPKNWRDVEEGIAALDGKQILFVTGAPKSGTTWLQLMLDTHPQIACRGEGSFFSKLAGALQTLFKASNTEAARNGALKGGKVPPFPQLDVPIALHVLRQVVLGSLATYGTAPETLVVGEKTPSTARGLDAVFACFPAAKVLHIARDGRDVCLSAWHHNLRDTGMDVREFFKTFDDFLPMMTEVWVEHQRPIFSHQADHPDAIQVVRYEDLLNDPTRIASQVFRWLDVEYDANTVASCVDATSFAALSDGRHPGEEDPTSFFRSGTEGGWREVFSEKQAQAFWEKAGKEMTALGYSQ